MENLSFSAGEDDKEYYFSETSYANKTYAWGTKSAKDTEDSFRSNSLKEDRDTIHLFHHLQGPVAPSRCIPIASNSLSWCQFSFPTNATMSTYFFVN